MTVTTSATSVGGTSAGRQETPIQVARNFTKATILRVKTAGRTLAVKTVRRHRRFTASFIARLLLRREARVLAALQHLGCVPRLVRAESGELVTEWIEGSTIRGRRHRGITAREATYVRAALAELHAAGMAHCDLGRDDVVITRDRAVLIDFATAVGPGAPPLLGRLLRNRLQSRDVARTDRVLRRARRLRHRYELLLASRDRNVPLSP